MQSSQNTMVSRPRDSAKHSQALWPWIVMPVVVLVVFYILHFEVRPQGRTPELTPSTLGSGGSE